MRAEIEIPDINAEEAASLKAGVALPDAFVAAGLDYNPAMSSLQATLIRRDGRSFLRLSSDRTINDPFVDLILEATWSSGRIVRDYTLLFDPPALRKAPAAPTLAQTPAAPATSNIPPRTAPAASAQPAAESAPRAATSKPSTPRTTAPVAVAKAPVAAADSDKQLVVKKGDTASKIAGSIKPADVSLDQMLVAMLRANPDAFVHDNLNRIRAGAILNVPTAESAQSVSAAEASKLVVAQSKDFNDFRRNLAANAPAAAVGAADRKASGAIEAKVEDKKPASTTPDKLTLSKGSVQSKADEAKIAKDREAKDAAARAAEINKNISDLNKLGVATKPAAAAPAEPASVAKPATPAPAVAVAPVPAPVAATPAPAASAPAAAVSAPAPQATAPAPKPKAAVPAPVQEEPGLLDELLADPLVPAGAVGLLALLGGFAAYRIRQRKKNSAQVDSAFLESRLQPDSFFGASGGQRIDTSNGPPSASSMVYSASQLDAADDVDPVAEADVYLAYGRDLQAEEILKEAVRTNPGRLAIHTKLLEIFSKRRDTRSFETTAAQAYKLTGANSPDWTRICEMGLAIDPTNALYQPGGAPASAGAAPAASGNSSFGASTVAMPASAAVADSGASGVDLDLDLDFSLDDEPASAISDVTGGTMSPSAEQTVKMEAQPQDNSLDMDFDLPDTPAVQAAPVPVPPMPEISLSLDDLETPMQANDVPAPKFEPTGPAPVEPVLAASPTADTGLMEFDLGSLSLDLDPPAAAQAPDSVGEDPLETKLALAEEFVSIGDEDGARALIEEVVSEASGDMRAKAQRALAKLS
ncbi:FimV/HubP family polar landmark protein [Rhodoferax saidenbachensis]|uniref:Pilus assembly protein FimV n=1 Tax=Rhodoferax saidenbachensis TaxID=1484693 RepID=A0ABU1ZLN7_9BURK|nr:FimV/HubP family polar landmark protein [Rhodoferax saidenbachensis]MDR7306452.1 pilus assembly protein FimV [Rhodoferax saidenbachensis]